MVIKRSGNTSNCKRSSGSSLLCVKSTEPDPTITVAGLGVVKNIATLGSSGLEGGGSTITQQLAKNLFKIRREKKGKLVRCIELDVLVKLPALSKNLMGGIK